VIAYNVEIKDPVTPALRQFVKDGKARGWVGAMESGVRRLFIDHFDELERTRPNQWGAPRTHFWAAVSNSVNTSRLANGFLLNISHPHFRQRLQGGTIRAGRNASWATGRPTKYLTIPARAEAYGKTSYEFKGELSLVFRRVGGQVRAVALAMNPRSRYSGVHYITAYNAKGKKVRRRQRTKITEGPLVYYWLVESVTQEPDPSVMPTEQDMTDAATNALSEWSDGVTARLKA